MIGKLANKVIDLENRLKMKSETNQLINDQLVKIEKIIHQWRRGGSAEDCLTEIEQLVFSNKRTSVTLPRIKTSCENQPF